MVYSAGNFFPQNVCSLGILISLTNYEGGELVLIHNRNRAVIFWNQTYMWFTSAYPFQLLAKSASGGYGPSKRIFYSQRRKQW